MTGLFKVIFFFMGLVLCYSAAAQQASPASTPNLDSLSQACREQNRKDKICDALITLQQLGNDSIEAIKEFVDLGPYSYTLLTVANFALQRRIRVRFPPMTVPGFRRRVSSTLDWQRDSISYTVSMEF
ncbi:MAG: hypothetical protein C5B49_04445 [Bdellovibrio sp.]|nr:MAG: hypothetical protein C5B49_04445 [Bdellovibrio sp.]